MATPLAISKLDIESILHNNTLSQDIKESILELFQINYALNEAAILAITDENGIIVYVNDEFCRISKYTKEEALGKTHRIINSGFHSKAFFKDMWETIKSGKTWRGDIKNKVKTETIIG